MLEHGTYALDEIIRYLLGQVADAHVADHHAGARAFLEQVVDLLTQIQI